MVDDDWELIMGFGRLWVKVAMIGVTKAMESCGCRLLVDIGSCSDSGNVWIFGFCSGLKLLGLIKLLNILGCWMVFRIGKNKRMVRGGGDKD